jgi:hypothetical protein
MTSITPQQFAEARTLIATRRQQIAEVATLQRQIAEARTASDRTYAFFKERLAFKAHPERLAGIAELAQRNPDWFKRIQMDYRWLLRDMLDPIALPRAPFPARPLEIDFHALPQPARPYLLGPFFAVHAAGRFAEVCLARSSPDAGKIVIVQTGGPMDAEAWRARLPALNAWLGDGWSIAADDASTVTLIRRRPLPATLPFHKQFLTRGALFVGIDVDTHRPVHIPFADLSAGTYIPGASGSGKTSALHILLRSIFINLDLFAAVYLVDGKDGVAMARYAGLHPKIKVLYDEPDVWQLAADLNSLMRQRNATQRAAGTDKATQDFIAVVIDELPTFVAKPSGDAKKEHAAFLDNLNRIAMRGRSAGIRMFFITQSPVAEQIPVTLRANCATALAFRLPEIAHATALFGTLTPQNDPRKLRTGQARLLQADAGTLATVQVPFAALWNPPRTPTEPPP